MPKSVFETGQAGTGHAQLPSTRSAPPGGGLVLSAVFFLVAIFISGYWATTGFGGNLTLAPALSDAAREDLAAFYRAGQMAAAGQAASAYDPDLFRAPFSEVNKGLLFLNPPHFLLFAEPLAYLTYPQAKIFLLGLLLLCVLLLTGLSGVRQRLLFTGLMLVSPGAYYILEYLQISPLITVLIVFALLQADKRPALSGIALAFATVKPQYGLLVPVFLMTFGYWAAIRWAAIGTAVLIVFSVAVYGIGTWQAFLASVLSGGHSEHAFRVHDLMVTVSNSLGHLNAGPEARLAAQVMALLGGGLAVWFAARHLCKAGAIAVFLLVSAFAAPSFMYYDWFQIQLAVLFLIAGRSVLPVMLQVPLAVLWSAPIAATILKLVGPLPFSIFDSLVPALIALCAGLIWMTVETAESTRRLTVRF